MKSPIQQNFLLALHGFLGKGHDWNFVKDHFEARLDVFAPDLFSEAPSKQTLKEEAQTIFEKSVLAAGQSTHKTLMGYSYGGRLALEMLFLKPQYFDRAIIVSSAFGIADDDQKSKRIKSDEEWARRFEILPWQDLIALWNQQEILTTTTAVFEREEADFNRKRLAEALRLRGQAMSSYQLPRVHGLKMPVLFLVGEADETYLQQAHLALKELPKARLEVITASSHRAPWQQKECFLRLIEEFIFSKA